MKELENISLTEELEKIKEEFKTDPVAKSSEDLLVSIQENELKSLKDVNIVNGSKINTYNVLNANKVVLSEESLEEIESNFSK